MRDYSDDIEFINETMPDVDYSIEFDDISDDAQDAENILQVQFENHLTANNVKYTSTDDIGGITIYIDEDADKIGLTYLGREYMSQFSDFELEINISVCRGLRLKDKLDPSVLTPEELDMADLAVMSAIELSERGVDLDARFPDIN